MPVNFMPPDTAEGEKSKYKTAGELRKSQMVTTFGSGSIIDLPRVSAIVSGIDAWEKWITEDGIIHEPNLEKMLGKEYFYQPASFDDNKGFGILVNRFPVWYYCPKCKKLDKYQVIAQDFSFSKDDKYNSPLFCTDCVGENGKKNVRLIPSRFVLACVNGHIDDFPYVWWVHNGGKCEHEHAKLYREQIGTTGGLDSILIRCECGKSRTMAGCISKDTFQGYRCSGSMPWLGTGEKGWYKDPKPCDAGVRGLQRSATNVYYPVNQSALTLPPWSGRIQAEISRYHGRLFDCFDEDTEERVIERLTKQYNKLDFNQYCSLEDFIKEVFVKFDYEPEEDINEGTLRYEEYQAFGTGNIDDEYLKTEETEVPSDLLPMISKIVMIKRLREVMVLRGFRRIEYSHPVEPEEIKKLGIDREFAPISKEPRKWLPAIEMFGEGIFIEFNNEALIEWEAENHDRYLHMANRMNYPWTWIGKEMFDEDSPRFVMLHTFAHLFIRQLTAQCGYATASLKEKIYSSLSASDKKMSGILIYTSATDCDGSLGGLVREGQSERIETTIRAMLEEASWCSNDPLCIDSKSQGYKDLNYAACHACLLLPETSCQHVNCLLDRASVIGTPENPEIGYFSSIR